MSSLSTGMTQGGAAVHQGLQLKNDVASMLANHRFDRIDATDYLASTGRNAAEKLSAAAASLMWPSDRVFVANVTVGQDVYYRDFEADILMRGPDWPNPLALICWHQRVSGSAIDKMPLSTMTMRERCCDDSLRFCILLEGDGIGEGPREFARCELARSGGRIVRVWQSIGEFRGFLTGGARYPESVLFQ